ncbi:MAG: hypothetical protein AAF492_07630, partial [Verrucomicrobiota bacterium]
DREQLVHPSASPGSLFGFSVAADSNRLVVGAPGHEDRGEVYVFDVDDLSWPPEAELLPANVSSNPAFGSRVAIDGERILISETGNENAPRDGRAWLFTYDALRSEWVNNREFFATRSEENFGSGLALLGSRIAIGADRAGIPGFPERIGAVRVIECLDHRLYMSYTDELLIDPACSNNVSVTRTWEVSDQSDNRASAGQHISVIADTTPPAGLEIPDDVTMECGVDAASIHPSNLVRCVGGPAGLSMRVYHQVTSASSLTPTISPLLADPNYSVSTMLPTLFSYEDREGMLNAHPELDSPLTFVLLWEGVLTIDPEDLGPWTFGSRGDDWVVWYIDLNRDGDFDDSDEQIVRVGPPAGGSRQETGSVMFSVPGCYPVVIALYQAGGPAQFEARFARGWGVPYDDLDVIDGEPGSSYPFFRSATTSSVPLPTAFDAGRPVTATVEEIYFEADACGSAGARIEREWIVTDGCGNARSRTQQVTFADAIAPILAPPHALTVEGNSPGGFVDDGAVADFLAGLPMQVFDFCDPFPDVEVDDAPLFFPMVCQGGEGTPVVVELVDCTGNERSESVRIFVRDSTPPVLTCPEDITWSDGDDLSPTGLAGFATAVDVCDPEPSVEFVDAVITGACPNAYRLRRTWIATDACRQSASCVQTIVLTGLPPPQLIAPSDLTIECDASIAPSNTGEALATYPLSGSLTLPFELDYSDQVSFDPCPGISSILRTWTVSDRCESVSSSVVQTITVMDTLPPEMTLPPDVTVGCGDSLDPTRTGWAQVDDCSDLNRLDCSGPLPLTPMDVVSPRDISFGSGVAIDGHVAVVGAVEDGPGAAYVFVREHASSWRQQAKLTPDVPTPSGAFGFSVAIDGDAIVVGEKQGSGTAYVFQREGTNWI